VPKVRNALEGLMHRDWWAGISGLVAIVSLVVAVAQLLLDQRVRLSSAVLVGASLVVGVVLLVLMRRPQQRLLLINNYRTDAARYYETVCQVLAGVRQELYYAGGGFHGLDDRSRRYGAQVNQATEQALRAGVRMYRVQTSDHSGEEWSRGLAAMLRDHPGRVEVYQDFGPSMFVDVGVYDPDDRNCVVQLVIKAERTYGVGGDARAGGTLFIFGNRELARGLQRLFARRIASLGPPMTEPEILALGTARDREQQP
jgi:hypothetical protein